MQKSFRKNILLSVIIFTIVGMILAFILNTNFSALRNNPFKSSKINILLVGFDSSINGPPRADTIILASIDLKSKGIGVLSIPRDTRVNIPGYGMNRVNATHAFGDIELTVKTLEAFFNVPIDYYVETDFNGFSRIIDALGGVELNIEKPLHYIDKAGNLYINLPAGAQQLNGDEALQYVRYRDSKYGDIGRVERQQKFIKAIMNKILKPEIVIKLPSIYKEVKDSVSTNIPLKDLSPFIHLVKDINMDHIKTTMLPGEPQYINGASYWIVFEDELEILLNNLIRSKEYIKNSNYNISIYNGNGVVGVASQLSSILKKYGFRIKNVENADNFDYKNTIIKYYDKRDKTAALGIHELIGGEIIYNNEEKEGLDIIIGLDFLKKGEEKKGS
jgi:polyisoprenyl-teichoic acid--peptidoglycan teichoic acid transferase